MKDFSWKEFKPTLLFLAKFIGLYVVGNMLYGAFITSFGKQADPVTHSVARQCSNILSVMGWPNTVVDHNKHPNTLIVYNNEALLAVYEGCNGINVMIIFVAFLLAFGPYTRALAWFTPLGLFAIHLGNLARIILLFWIALYYPDYMYFLHKYFFTAIIYLVVFIFWIIWVRSYALKRHES